jgi:hypothetical protein
MEEVNILNPEDKDYYEGKLFRVCIWSGMGYSLYSYDVYANHEEEALNLAVKYAEREGDPILFSWDEVEQDAEENDEGDDAESYIDEYYVYVDATMEGAENPWFILRENLRIERLEEN